MPSPVQTLPDQAIEPGRNPPRAVLFDAYGTLFDVYSVGQLAEELFPGQGQALSVLWRDKQIEYTRLVTTSNHGAHYQPFRRADPRRAGVCHQETGGRPWRRTDEADFCWSMSPPSTCCWPSTST